MIGESEEGKRLFCRGQIAAAAPAIAAPPALPLRPQPAAAPARPAPQPPAITAVAPPSSAPALVPSEPAATVTSSPPPPRPAAAAAPAAEPKPAEAKPAAKPAPKPVPKPAAKPAPKPAAEAKPAESGEDREQEGQHAVAHRCRSKGRKGSTCAAGELAAAPVIIALVAELVGAAPRLSDAGAAAQAQSGRP